MGTSVAVETRALPEHTLLQKALPLIHYADSYRSQLPAGREISAAELARAFFTTVPAWVAWLLRLRNRLVALIGLKTSAVDLQGVPPLSSFEEGTTIGLFKIFRRTPDELVMGEDDRHLDFRVSLMVEREGAQQFAVVSTIVRFNGWLGRAYFLPVRFFHRLIVPAMLRRMVAAMRSEE